MVSECWTLTDMAVLVRTLREVNFFYQDSRNAALRALGKFAKDARSGGEIVGAALRFPDDPRYFACTDDFNALLADLQGALTWRDGNSAKDTDVHKAVRNGKEPENGSADQPKFLGQSAQDASKRFQVLMAKLGDFKANESVWRPTFEADCEAVWA